MKQILKNILWFLPYAVRRFLFRVVNNKEYKEISNARMHEGTIYKSFDDKKCIFIHIPKCAGVSVTKSLFNAPGAGHKNILKYQMIFSEQEFNEYFKFAFVRNPWDRLVSAYFFLRSGGMYERDKQWYENNLSKYDSFDDFVKNWVNRKNIFKYIHFVPQYKFICDQNHAVKVDFIGCFENFQKDFDFIKKRLRVQANLECHNTNKINKSDYRKYYNEQTMQIVADVYREDIQLFNYNFDT